MGRRGFSPSTMAEAVAGNTKSLPVSREALHQQRSGLVALCVQCGFQDIGSLRPFGSLDDVKLDALALFEGLESFAEQSRIVDKDIISIVQPDEPEPLSIIEPFDCPLTFHTALLSCVATRQGAAWADDNRRFRTADKRR